MLSKDIILFMKYNEKNLRQTMPTNFYTDQDFERMLFNCETQLENYIKIREGYKYDQR